MKWRDRISILSRKRRQRSTLQPGNGMRDHSSGSGHAGQWSRGGTGDSSVASTLAQLQPVIGPDHKSYYILLRGAGDSFMCIQPAKEVMNSLEDVMKNVLAFVQREKLLEVPAHARSSGNNVQLEKSELATHTKASLKQVQQEMPAELLLPSRVVNNIQAEKSPDQTAQPTIVLNHLKPRKVASVTIPNKIVLSSVPVHSSKAANVSAHAKNVISIEESDKLYELLSKKPKHSQSKVSFSELIQKPGRSKKRIGVQSSPLLMLNRVSKQKSGARLDSECVDKVALMLDSDSVVENVVLNGLLQNVNSDQRSQVTRTSSLVFPLAQDKLASSNTKIINKTQESCILISGDDYETESESIALASAESGTIPDSLYENIPNRKRQMCVSSSITSEQDYSKSQVANQSFSSTELQDLALETCLTSTLENVKQPSSQPDIQLVAREGTVLTEDQIAAQIKNLIESEQLVVKENQQIVVIKVSSEAAMVRTVKREFETRKTVQMEVKETRESEVGEMDEREAQEVLHSSTHQPQVTRLQSGDVMKSEVSVKEELFESSSPVQEEPCIQFHPTEAERDDNRDLSSLFTEYTKLKEEAFASSDTVTELQELQYQAVEESEGCQYQTQEIQYQAAQVKDVQFHSAGEEESVHFSSADQAESVQYSCLGKSENAQFRTEDQLFNEAGGFQFPEHIVNEAVGYEGGDIPVNVDDIKRVEAALLGDSEEIVVFQREDGALVNRDGTPVSSEIQYLISSYQQGYYPDLDQPSPSLDHTSPSLDHTSLLLPPGPLIHPSININCRL